jgi:hypothetical protein
VVVVGSVSVPSLVEPVSLSLVVADSELSESVEGFVVDAVVSSVSVDPMSSPAQPPRASPSAAKTGKIRLLA